MKSGVSAIVVKALWQPAEVRVRLLPPACFLVFPLLRVLLSLCFQLAIVEAYAFLTECISSPAGAKRRSLVVAHLAGGSVPRAITGSDQSGAVNLVDVLVNGTNSGSFRLMKVRARHVLAISTDTL